MNALENSYLILNNSLIRASEMPSYNTKDEVVIYEVVRVMGKRILFLEDHIERFLASFKVLHYEIKLTDRQITNQLYRLIKANEFENGNLKFQIQIDKATGNQNFVAFFIPHSYPTQKQYQDGVAVSLLEALRPEPNAKVQNTLLRNTTDEIIKQQGVYEVLLTHDGFVSEGSRSNLFTIKDNRVITPQIAEILPGVTRKHLIKVCNDHKIEIKESPISITELLNMDALFLSGTSPKILPISRVENKKFDVNNSLLRYLMLEFDEYIHNYFKTTPIFL